MVLTLLLSSYWSDTDASKLHVHEFTTYERAASLATVITVWL